MINCKIKLTFIILILLLGACVKKDELTLPVKVQLRIGIQPGSTLNAEYLSLTECKIGIESVLFEGKREAGEDILFTSNPALNLQTLSFLQPAIISDFQIPQGIYTSMQWDLSLKCIENEEFLSYGYASDLCMGIFISGYYQYLDGYIIPFLFAIEEPEQFSVRAYNQENDTRIIISVNKEYVATVSLALEYAFRGISRESFEKAEVSGKSDNPFILISSTQNTSLNEVLLYRLFQSARVLVKSNDLLLQ